MNFKNIFGNKSKRKAPHWNELSRSKQREVQKKFLNMAGAHYRIVQGDDAYNREQGRVETQNEDFYLNHYRRGRLLDQARNATRNSSTFNTILKQFDVNVVGVKGGKAIFNFDDSDLNRELKEKFSYFTRQADFFDGLSFNQILKLILKNQIIGGDCVILFDDGLVENSGKLLVYESDEIGNTTEEAIKEHYGKDAHQSLGKVYNGNGRWIGTVVSRACRGMETFDPDKCYFLHRDPNLSNFTSKWLMPQNIWRVNQGRGISQIASSLGAILDLEDITGFEIQAAKKNAQTFAQIVKTNTSNEHTQLPSTFDDGTDFSEMTDEQIEEAAKQEANDEQVISFSRASSCGIVYEQLPDDYKMEILDQKHPNQNMQEFIEWIAGRSSAVFGLSRAFATGNPTGADFRAQQLMTQPAFIECQKQLEQICDWCMYRYVWWMHNNGLFDANKLPKSWMMHIDWQWSKIDEIDEVQNQRAIELKLKNCTGTLRETLGSDWKEKINQIADEIKYCESLGIPHPALNMKSGGVRPEVYTHIQEKE